MRLSPLIVAASLALAAQASWFSSSDPDPEYSKWNNNELRAWLEVHNVPLPKHSTTHSDLVALVGENWNTASAWTYDQYASAQKSFSDLRDTAFDTWDDSRLREWLLEHGVVAPKGPREHLVLLAKQKYRSYSNAASSYASRASATASTAIYGDATHQASKSASSVVSKATSAVSQAVDDAASTLDAQKDYVYSTWDDNRLRKYLEEKGVVKSKAQLRRDELLAKMYDAYAAVANPIWEAWSDSYIHRWLVNHHIIKSDFEGTRDILTKHMNKYYYTTTDTIYTNWSDSDLRQWLIKNGIIKSDAQVTRDKMMKLVSDNYLSAKDTFWHAWSDNHLREWLVSNGYLRSDAQVKRDELVRLANEKYHDQTAKTAAYLAWPDARLRAYLREHGVDDHKIPTTRPGLLQETRIRWVQTHTRAENLFAKIKEIVNSGIYKAEDALLHLVSLLGGGWEETKEKAENTKRAAERQYEDVKHQGEAGWEEAKNKADEAYGSAKHQGEKAYGAAKHQGEAAYGTAKRTADKVASEAEKKADDAKNWASESTENVRQNVGEKVKKTGQKIKGEL
ncbi:hypothetical protein D9613_003832 [Agrocybe pediades]|uniref:Meiotic sister chromatid recombination protein 1 n=1 Tax=Agrocybe pediades TaxID=84607 RepID=A0A8H4QI47_9AGAR|nr:hypothetical protein D9613_003832 [Agrocybe pediades]